MTQNLRIGTLFPMSGVIALYEKWCYNGVLIAADTVSKSAATALTKALAIEALYKIRVNSISPVAAETPML